MCVVCVVVAVLFFYYVEFPLVLRRPTPGTAVYSGIPLLLYYNSHIILSLNYTAAVVCCTRVSNSNLILTLSVELTVDVFQFL